MASGVVAAARARRAASSPRDWSRATIASRAPRAANASAAARPIPLVAPVMTTRLRATPSHCGELIAGTPFLANEQSGAPYWRASRTPGPRYMARSPSPLACRLGIPS